MKKNPLNKKKGRDLSLLILNSYPEPCENTCDCFPMTFPNLKDSRSVPGLNHVASWISLRCSSVVQNVHSVQHNLDA